MRKTGRERRQGTRQNAKEGKDKRTLFLLCQISVKFYRLHSFMVSQVINTANLLTDGH
jgi:hypothetical protein